MIYYYNIWYYNSFGLKLNTFHAAYLAEFSIYCLCLMLIHGRNRLRGEGEGGCALSDSLSLDPD